jgi:hypothetical protein
VTSTLPGAPQVRPKGFAVLALLAGFYALYLALLAVALRKTPFVSLVAIFGAWSAATAAYALWKAKQWTYFAVVLWGGGTLLLMLVLAATFPAFSAANGRSAILTSAIGWLVMIAAIAWYARRALKRSKQ